jgi:hypothetical protein
MMIAIFFWWIGLSIVVAVAANTRGPRPDRVVHLRHHLFAFAQRLAAAGAAQPFELVRRWADVLSWHDISLV